MRSSRSVGGSPEAEIQERWIPRCDDSVQLLDSSWRRTCFSVVEVRNELEE